MLNPWRFSLCDDTIFLVPTLFPYIVPIHKWFFGASQAWLPAQYLRYAQEIILGGKRACETPISNRCLRLFFSYASILKKIAILGQPPRTVLYPQINCTELPTS